MIEGIIDKPLPFRPCSALIQGKQKSPLPGFVEISPALCNFEAKNKQSISEHSIVESLNKTCLHKVKANLR